MLIEISNWYYMEIQASSSIKIKPETNTVIWYKIWEKWGWITAEIDVSMTYEEAHPKNTLPKPQVRLVTQAGK